MRRHGGFPEPLRTHLLRGKPGLSGRPGAQLPPFDFEAARAHLAERDGGTPRCLLAQQTMGRDRETYWRYFAAVPIPKILVLCRLCTDADLMLHLMS